MQRERRSLRLDLATVEQARKRAGLPADAPVSAVVRYALAELAGTDTVTALDSTPGRGAMSYRKRAAEPHALRTMRPSRAMHSAPIKGHVMV